MAVLTVVTSYVILFRPTSHPPVDPASPDSRLEVVGVFVREDAPATRTLTPVSGDDRGEFSAIATAGIEFLVKNSGDVASVISKAELTIEDARILEGCAGTGGNVRVTGRYDADLPRDPSVGMSIEVPLHQEVLARRGDRFSISVGLEGSPSRRLSRSVIFHLGVRLFHDGSAEPLSAGNVVLATEFPGLDNPSEYFRNPYGSWLCAWENWRALRHMLSLPGARSAELHELGESAVLHRIDDHREEVDAEIAYENVDPDFGCGELPSAEDGRDVIDLGGDGSWELVVNGHCSHAKDKAAALVVYALSTDGRPILLQRLYTADQGIRFLSFMVRMPRGILSASGGTRTADGKGGWRYFDEVWRWEADEFVRTKAQTYRF